MRVEVRLSGAAGEYMDEATVIEIHVAAGDPVAGEQVIAVVETAKATTEIVSPVDGVLTEWAVSEDEEVPLGGLLAVVTTSDE